MSARKAKPPLVWASERTVSGLEFLRRIIAGETAFAPIGNELGFHCVDVEHGRIVLAGTPGERFYNLIGTVHGGWTATVLDTAMALSTLSTLDAKAGFTTLDIKVAYLRPITAQTGEVRAEGRVVHEGRRVSLSESRLTDKEGKLLAHGTSTCLILPR